MWTLAVATLIGRELPDDVPLSYAHRDIIPTLTDHYTPQVYPQQYEYARRVAEESVAELQRLIPLPESE
jgi:hypothetical protein